MLRQSGFLFLCCELLAPMPYYTYSKCEGISCWPDYCRYNIIASSLLNVHDTRWNCTTTTLYSTRVTHPWECTI